MKLLNIFLLTLISMLLATPPGWDMEATETNHTIFIYEDANPRIGDQPLEDGDFIGVFYSLDDSVKCCGYIEWHPGESQALSAWGDDSSTPEKDGLDNGEEFKWKLYKSSDGLEYIGNVTYMEATGPLISHTNLFAPDGISGLADIYGGGVGVEEGLISDFVVVKNYPNPFNPETIISFSLEKRADVKLTIYNSEGEIVSTLINGRLNRGDHFSSFNGRDLSSGVYFYQLKVDTHQYFGKMALVK